MNIIDELCSDSHLGPYVASVCLQMYFNRRQNMQYKNVLEGSILGGKPWAFSGQGCRLGTSLSEESAPFFLIDFVLYSV